ncbi:MAG: histidine kinase [Paenibacillus sp.]|jgi:signal transduction histidine kinase|nr:histidine kinase [Paenibacillus sp.]
MDFHYTFAPFFAIFTAGGAVILYILMFISLWTIGALLIRNGRNAGSVVMGIAMVVGGCSSFAFAIHLSIIPYFEQWRPVTGGLKQLLHAISLVAAYTYWYFLYYCALVSALLLGNWLPPNRRKTFIVCLALPLMVLLVYHLCTKPLWIVNVGEIRIIAGLYMMASCLFFIASWLRGTTTLIKRLYLRTMLVSTTALLWSYMVDFLGMSRIVFDSAGFRIESNGLWEYNYLIILWLLLFFIFFGVKYGIWGIKLRFEREKHDYSMKALTLGTSILNHSIKNELSKINYLNERAQSNIRLNHQATAIEQLEIVEDVTRHMLNMVDRIKEKTNDIHLVERHHQVEELIQYTVLTLDPILEANRMKLETQLEAKGLLWCDAEHMKEAITNVMMNALDAMKPGEGVLVLATKLVKNQLVIEVKDNGCGIPKDQMDKVFDPFFTTKRSSTSFGLGLSYCYGVMQKHGGSVYIAETSPGVGTTVCLQFPRNRFQLREEG